MPASTPKFREPVKQAPAIEEPVRRGAPRRLHEGRRVNVFLDAATVARAMKAGNGNLSEGIRILCAAGQKNR
jgi:hypothetical protein